MNRKHDFLSRQHKSDLADSQKKALYSLKLAAAPKSDEESRAIATIGAHSKTAFSSFAASDLKKRVVKESLKRQRGAKPAGAEAIVHTFQQIRVLQNPDFDVFSADAVKAVYSLKQ